MISPDVSNVEGDPNAVRDTCCQGPLPTVWPVLLSMIREMRRDAVAQTPTVAPALSGSV